jgi:branched-chain amino acid transport system ATP-binding protein
MLELESVHTYLSASHILQGISISVGEGEIVSLLGRNGAGKTTTVSTIMGFAAARRGEIRFRGETIRGLPPYRIARRGLGMVPQGRRIFPGLSVEENLTLAARPGSRKIWDLERVQEVFPILKERGRIRGGALSGGEQQMLAIGRTLMTNPDLLLMDEPSEGLAPIVVREIGRIVRELKETGLSVLLVEQNLELALGVGDRTYVMNKGRIVFEGTCMELSENETVKKQFLGV